MWSFVSEGISVPTTYMPLYSSDAEDGDDLTDNGINCHEMRSLPISIPLRNRNPSETSTATSQSTVASNESSVRNSFAKAPAEDRSKYEKFIDADADEDHDRTYCLLLAFESVSIVSDLRVELGNVSTDRNFVRLNTFHLTTDDSFSNVSF